MLLRQRYKLSIPEPCHEDWQKMHPVDRGRFCDSCTKVVTDFSQMTETEIMSFFKNKPQNACGRFTKTQLDKTYASSPTFRIPAHKRLIRYIMSVFLIGGAVKQVKSQSLDSLLVQTDSSFKDSSLAVSNISVDSLTIKNDSLKSDSVKPLIKIAEFKWEFDPSILTTITGNVATITGFTVSHPEKPTVFSELRKRFAGLMCKEAGVRVTEIDAIKIVKREGITEDNKVPVPAPKDIPAQKSEAILPSFFSWRGRNAGAEPKKS